MMLLITAPWLRSCWLDPARGASCRIAEHLYGKREWTMQRIAEALGVSKSQISNDLEGFPVSGKPARPKGGRPKGSRPKKPAHKKGLSPR
jgi:hypothetical protein